MLYTKGIGDWFPYLCTLKTGYYLWILILLLSSLGSRKTSLALLTPVVERLPLPTGQGFKRCVKDSRRVYMESILFKNELVKMTKKEAYRLLSQDNWDDLSNRLTFYFWTLPGEGRFTLFICQKE